MSIWDWVARGWKLQGNGRAYRWMRKVRITCKCQRCKERGVQYDADDMNSLWMKSPSIRIEESTPQRGIHISLYWYSQWETWMRIKFVVNSLSRWRARTMAHSLSTPHCRNGRSNNPKVISQQKLYGRSRGTWRLLVIPWQYHTEAWVTIRRRPGRMEVSRQTTGNQ